MSCIIESIILFSPEDFPGMEDQRFHLEEITFHPEKIVYRLQNCIDTGTGPDGAFLITGAVWWAGDETSPGRALCLDL